MLRDKNLLENTDLVKELDDQDSEVISGGRIEPQGGLIKVENGTSFPLLVDFKYGNQKLIDELIDPGDHRELLNPNVDAGTLDLDNDICQAGIQFKRYPLTAGRLYSLERSGNCLITLQDKGPIT